MTTLMYGATDEFYNKEKKKAIEYVVEQKAGKKTKDNLSGKNIGKNLDSTRFI